MSRSSVSANAEVWSGFLAVLGRLLTKEEKTQALLEYARFKKFDGLDHAMGLTDSMPSTGSSTTSQLPGRPTVRKISKTRYHT